MNPNLKDIISQTLEEQCSKCLDTAQERAEVLEALLSNLNRENDDASTDTFSEDKERFMAP